MEYTSYCRKTKPIIFTLFALLYIFCSVKTVSAHEPDFDGNGAGYTAVLYNNSNGLPTSEANAIAQTEDGFIWIGSYSGLIRYDGNDFYRYDSSVGITSVMSLYVDSGDRLWIGTNDNGAALYENGEFRFYGRKEGLISLSVRSIAEDGAGNIILATTQGMAYIDASDELHILDDSHINKEYVCEIKADADGTIYGETLSGAFFSMENLKVTFFYDSDVNCICPDPDVKGMVYLGTDESYVIYGSIDGMRDSGSRLISVAPQVNINAIYPAPDGKIWICADNGIGYLDAERHYTELTNVPMNNSVDEMMLDYEGNLWFASSRQGVMKVVGSPFTNITEMAGLSAEVVNSTCIYQNDLYIGTDAGLRLLDESFMQKENVLTKLLDGIRIRCIKADSAGNLWLCTYSENGLVCYHGDDTYTIYNEESGIKSNRVRAMTELSDGSIAAATSGGVSLIKDGRVTDAFDTDDGISNTEILCICEGDGGKLYMGSDGDGIYIADEGGISRLGVEDGLKSEIILRIKKDTERSVYWIITGNSISYMKDEKITTLSHFPYSNNFDMYFDNAGGIWILSSNGIYVVNGEQLLADEEMEYSFYDMNCGLPCVATANSRSCISEDGILYISGTTGVSSININENQDMGGNVRLTVPFIGVDDELLTIKNGEEIIIPSDCKRLTIYGYAITYSLQNPRLNYYLQGFDDEQASVSKQDMQPVVYTNLDGGGYVFHMSVINTMTGEEENSIAVTLIKEKAFYEQVWFWMLILLTVILFVLGIAVLYTRLKTAKLLKKQEENRRFINQTIHAFAKCIDLKDKYTNGHSFRVAEYAGKLAKKMGYDEARVTDIYNIALLHDIGKIAIPDEILNKPEELNDEEYEIVKQHALNGYEILKEIEISPELALGAEYHHERLDGKGYPSGKTGEEIPHIAQIIAVADTFDAMNSTRPYRKQMPMEVIVERLKQISGTQLNAEIVQVLLDLIEAGGLA